MPSSGEGMPSAPRSRPQDLARRLSSAPVFIGGAERSGTTLLRTVLDSHSRLAASPETHLAQALARARPGDWQELADRLRQYPWWRELDVPGVSRDLDVQRRLAEDVMSAYLLHAGKARWLEKSPSNIRHLGLLRVLFPDALFLHCIRDGRDAVCSLVEHRHFRDRSRGVPKHLKATIAWALYVRSGRQWATKLGNAYREVRYEALVTEPESTISGVLEFLGEPWEEQVLDFYRFPHDWTIDGQRIERPIDAESVGRWRRDLQLRHRLLFRLLAGRELARAGYSWR